MFPVLNLGPFAIQSAGLILICGVWIGITVAEKKAQFIQVNPQDVENLILILLGSGVIGARLSFALQSIDVFIADPIQILSLQTAMMDNSGGLLFALVGGLIFIQRKKIPIRFAADGLVPFLNILLIAYYLASFASANIFGKETDCFFGMLLFGERRHPVALYAGIFLCIIFFFSPLFEKWIMTSKHIEQKEGIKFLIFLFLTSLCVLFIEYFRENVSLLSDSLNQNQFVAFILMLVSGIALLRKSNISSNMEIK
ncbi:MAG: prolipoprotein diacylglyceryl transferase [Anaerolineaceae bacterium]|nr:prolipoprotein diacylglyceryl transferase [Anaerolineaceae bacterium]